MNRWNEISGDQMSAATQRSLSLPRFIGLKMLLHGISLAEVWA